MVVFHYVYILRSRKDQGLYIGSTNNLRLRFRKHNNGEVFSSKPRRPFDLIFYEAYRNLADSKRREIYLKSTKGRTTIKTMLQAFFLEVQNKPRSIFPESTL